MNASQSQLYEKLRRFDVDQEDVVFPFSARLARENGWSLEYARRVIEEYRRFILLACAADHPVTPSDAVDQAWHLHLIYTESYWNDLCRELLERPLHHGPTKGGSKESTKYRDQYEKTKASYRKIFEQEPPRDIWPDSRPSVNVPRYQRVNLASYWLVPKPQFLRTFGGRKPSRSPVSTAFALGFLPVAFEFSNPLNWLGPEFLALYGTLFVLLVTVIGLIKFFQNRPDESSGFKEPSLADPYELACLAGGRRRVVEAATAALVRSGTLKAEVSTRRAVLTAGSELPKSMHPIERIIRASICAADGVPYGRQFRNLAEPSIAKIEDALAKKGLLQPPATGMARCWPLLTMMPLLVLGSVKLFIGIERDKPVGFLVIALVITVVTMCCLAISRTRRTSAGKRLLQKIRSTSSRDQLKAELECNPVSVLGLDVPFAFQVGLLGLAGTLGATDPLVRVFAPSGCAGANSSYAGCGGGASGCGGGGGGGGCGGGGCGGCGGGGCGGGS